MTRYSVIFNSKEGIFFENVLSETPISKGREVHVRGANHTVKTAVLAESQVPHLGDILAQKPKTRRKK